MNPTLQEASPLSEEPMERALAAYETQGKGKPRLFVLGDDLAWRWIDNGDIVPAQDSGGYGSAALRPNSLSADGHQLAVPQPDAVVVVDLTTGQTERYKAPGFNMALAWSPDSQQILVGTESRAGGTLLDIPTSDLIRVPYNPHNATFLPNGDVITLSSPDPLETNLDRYADNTLVESTPLEVSVGAGVGTNLSLVASATDVATVRQVNQWEGKRGIVDRYGPIVLDVNTGQPKAQLPIYSYRLLLTSTPLIWLDEETAIYRIGSDVIAWDYSTGQLQEVTQLDTGSPDSATLAIAQNLSDD